MAYVISIYHETRRLKENGKFSVKLRIYNKNNNVKKVRYFTTDIDLTENEFEVIWTNPKNKSLRGKNREIELRLKDIETRANRVAEEMTVFDFDKFETKFFRKSSESVNELLKTKYQDDMTMTEGLKLTLRCLRSVIDNPKSNSQIAVITKRGTTYLDADKIEEINQAVQKEDEENK